MTVRKAVTLLNSITTDVRLKRLGEYKQLTKQTPNLTPPLTIKFQTANGQSVYQTGFCVLSYLGFMFLRITSIPKVAIKAKVAVSVTA